MSIYKRKSGKYAVLVDAEDTQPFRIVEPLPPATVLGRDGKTYLRRRTRIVKRFKTHSEAEKEFARLTKTGNPIALSIEKLARGRRTLGTFRTHKEAERAERAALSALDSGSTIAPGTATIVQILERFLAGREDLGRALKTTTEYRRQARLYIMPHLGDRAVAKLRPAHVSDWLSMLLRNGGQDGRALSAKSVNHAYRLLSAALRWAERMELVSRNVCESVSPPSVPKSAARAFDDAEIVALISAAAGTRWEAYIIVALAVGARRSELLALNWSDADLSGGLLSISKAMCQITGSAPFVKGTKTGSRRSVPLAGIALQALRKQRARQAAERLEAGALYRRDPSEPIFTNEFGDRLTPQSATSGFKKIARQAGIRTGSLHSLRHSAATHLLASGVDIATTAGVLGHANASVTLNVYGHVLGDGLRSATDRLGARLEKIRDAG